MANDRDEAQRRLVAAIAQHTAYLHRTGTAHVNKINAIIDDAGSELARELNDRLDNLAPAELQAFAQGRYHTSRLKGLRKALDTWVDKLGDRIRTLSIDEIEQLAAQEAGYMRDLLAEAIGDTLPAAPAAAAATAVMTQPVLGQFVEDMLAGIPENTRRQVYSRLRQGFTEGEANGQIVRALRGTKALGFKDGLLQATRNEAERIVRTARAHASHVAYEETYDALGVTELVWTAQLEARTCKRCAPLDGQRFKRDKPHPVDPLHINCRCKLAPSLGGDVMGKRPYVKAMKVRNGYRIDPETGERVPRGPHYRSIGDMTKTQRENVGLEVGQVSANTTFSDWFGRQDAAFQREWLGPRKYKLYSEGGYTLDRFTDPRNREYTLDELRQRDAAIFAELFG
jgi:SPP1 gp7 family putative phage head morphogenesis protein